MINKNRTQIFEKGAHAEIPYARHSNGIVPCADLKKMGQRAQTCWRRNPHTGRLEMHWQVTPACALKAIARRGLSKAAAESRPWCASCKWLPRQAAAESTANYRSYLAGRSSHPRRVSLAPNQSSAFVLYAPRLCATQPTDAATTLNEVQISAA